MLGVFRDEKEATKTRIEAASWLADRGFGRAVQPTQRLDEAEKSLDQAVGELSPGERKQLESKVAGKLRAMLDAA